MIALLVAMRIGIVEGNEAVAEVPKARPIARSLRRQAVWKIIKSRAVMLVSLVLPCYGRAKRGQ